MGWRLVSKLTNWYAQDIAPRTDNKADEQLMPLIRRMLLAAGAGVRCHYHSRPFQC